MPEMGNKGRGAVKGQEDVWNFMMPRE